MRRAELNSKRAADLSQGTIRASDGELHAAHRCGAVVAAIRLSFLKRMHDHEGGCSAPGRERRAVP
jgi:hypothetical protein